MKSNFRSVQLTIAILLMAVALGTAAVRAAPQDGMPDSAALENANPNSPAPSNAEAGMNFLRLLTLGGWFMIPLAILSLAVVTIAFERFISLRREKVFPARFVRQLSSLCSMPGGLEPRSAYEICQRFPSAASNVFKSLLVKVGRPQMELENAVSEASQRQATRMLQWVSWLSLAAAIAPLIGLLGTVWGITQTFHDTTQLVAGQNRAEALAEGIYIALVTTIVGLIIAIPAAILAHFFENRIVSLMNEIEEMIFNLMPQLERYEGKIRFSEVHAAEAGSSVGSEDHGMRVGKPGEALRSATPHADGVDTESSASAAKRGRRPPTGVPR